MGLEFSVPRRRCAEYDVPTLLVTATGEVPVPVDYPYLWFDARCTQHGSVFIALLIAISRYLYRDIYSDISAHVRRI